MTTEHGRCKPPTTKFHGREVQVNPTPKTIMGDREPSLPVGMIPFIRTSVAQPFIVGRNAGLTVSVVIAVGLATVFLWLSVSSWVALSLALLTFVVNATVLLLRYHSHASTPLAVNINHPFMEGEPLGHASLLVQLSDGTWCNPGPHRVRVIRDDLMGGFSLAQDTLDFPVLGHFSQKREKTPTMVRHLALINQAIALRDAVNEVPDPIEDARERENTDSGLLERSWLEEEKELEVESPLVSFFRKKE